MDSTYSFTTYSSATCDSVKSVAPFTPSQIQPLGIELSIVVRLSLALVGVILISVV
jgi:hypothetical protein